MTTTRDPKRIDRMIKLLREVWSHSPDLRLTQLVINVADKQHDCGPVFYVEDTEIEKKLDAMISKRKEHLDKCKIESGEPTS